MGIKKQLIDRKQVGTAGEREAKSYLVKEGYKICDENYTCSRGEIDFVAWDKEYLVFIEVRSRRGSLSFGKPFESVTREKQKRLILLSQIYTHHKKLSNCNVRFDVVSVILDGSLNLKKIDLIKNAF